MVNKIRKLHKDPNNTQNYNTENVNTEDDNTEDNSAEDDNKEVVNTVEYCGNCGKKLETEDKYCRHCGTRRGKGAFKPQDNEMMVLYGPDFSVKYSCKVCSYEWNETNLGFAPRRYCPRCGAAIDDDGITGNRGYSEYTDEDISCLDLSETILEILNKNGITIVTELLESTRERILELCNGDENACKKVIESLDIYVDKWNKSISEDFGGDYAGIYTKYKL